MAVRFGGIHLRCAHFQNSQRASEFSVGYDSVAQDVLETPQRLTTVRDIVYKGKNRNPNRLIEL